MNFSCSAEPLSPTSGCFLFSKLCLNWGPMSVLGLSVYDLCVCWLDEHSSSHFLWFASIPLTMGCSFLFSLTSAWRRAQYNTSSTLWGELSATQVMTSHLSTLALCLTAGKCFLGSVLCVNLVPGIKAYKSHQSIPAVEEVIRLCDCGQI